MPRASGSLPTGGRSTTGPISDLPKVAPGKGLALWILGEFTGDEDGNPCSGPVNLGSDHVVLDVRLAGIRSASVELRLGYRLGWTRSPAEALPKGWVPMDPLPAEQWPWG